MPATANRTWMCVICGWIYNEADGAPAEGIPAGTPWGDVPPDWQCPECGARRTAFDMVEI
jgi:rubredoxin